MAINQKLRELLDRNQARYEVIPHEETFTAQDVAESAHVQGRRVAKVVVMRDAAGTDFMVVLPAPWHMDAGIVERVTGRSGVQLEDEQGLIRLFPDCELGAMPPFGMLYGMTMYVDPCLADQEAIHFQAGNHRELVRMRFDDYARVAGPFEKDVCMHRELAGTGR